MVFVLDYSWQPVEDDGALASLGVYPLIVGDTLTGS